MAGKHIDRDKLRAAIRRMGSEYIFYMLDNAITLLPQNYDCAVPESGRASSGRR